MFDPKKVECQKLSRLSYAKSLTVMILFFVLISFRAYSSDTRNIKCDCSKQLSLAENGKANFVIVIPPEASKVTAFASKELKVFIDKALNSDIPILTEADGNIPALVVGDCDLARKAGLDIKKLPRDGYYIKTVGNNIFILGADDPSANPEENMKSGRFSSIYYERATLFAVYDFLERFLGVRFYFPGEIGTVVPKIKDLKIPAADITDSPDYTTRKYSWVVGKWFEEAKPNEILRNKHLNNLRMRTETDYIPNCHGLFKMEYLRRFGKTHPEYFALLRNGKRNNEKDVSVSHQEQLCYNSGIQEEIYKDAEAYLTGKSAESRDLAAWHPVAAWKNYFNIMPQDGFVRCLCEKCVKDKRDNDELVWDMTCETAEKLKKNNIPGYITQMAYGSFGNVPERKIPDNVLVMVAVSGPWAEENDKARKKDDEIVINWTKKLGHKVWLWNYTLNCTRTSDYGFPGTVQMTPRAIGKYYRRLAPYITGAYLNSDTDYFIRNYLNYYVFSKVSWNNKVDLDALLDEHYRMMFGAASGQMKKFYEELERIWTGSITKNSVNTPLGPVIVRPNDFDLWRKFYDPEKLENFKKLFDKAEKLTENDTDSLKRVRFMRENLLFPILEGSEKYFAKAKELESLKVQVKTIPTEEKIIIDGKLDDPAWKSGSRIFLLPFKADNCEVKTEVYLLKNKENLYIAFNCMEPEISMIKCPERKANDPLMWLDSCVEIHLNPSGNYKDLLHMIINAAGSVYQKYNMIAGKSQGEANDWKSHAEIKTNIQKDRWTAEIAIPLKEMKNLNEKGFPANFIRTRGLTGTVPEVLHYTWTPFLKHNFNEMENYGTLDFSSEKSVPIINNGEFAEPWKENSCGKWGFPLNNIYNKPSPGYSVSMDASTFMKAGQSLKIVNTGGSMTIVQSPLPLKPNTRYILSFYLKMQDVEPLEQWGGVTVQIYFDKTSLWFPKYPFKGTSSWLKHGFNFKTGNETKSGGIKLWVKEARGTLWFDDISITETGISGVDKLSSNANMITDQALN